MRDAFREAYLKLLPPVENIHYVEGGGVGGIYFFRHLLLILHIFAPSEGNVITLDCVNCYRIDGKYIQHRKLNFRSFPFGCQQKVG